MSFSTDMAKLVTEQLSRFNTLNRHQIAGQVANLDFWLAEVRHALDVLNGYGSRFQLLKTAQAKHVKEHHTTEFFVIDPELPAGPAPLRKVPEKELKDARLALCDAARGSTRHTAPRATPTTTPRCATRRERCPRPWRRRFLSPRESNEADNGFSSRLPIAARDFLRRCATGYSRNFRAATRRKMRVENDYLGPGL